MTATLTTAPPVRQIELAIGGMTCATCAGRVERKLNRMDGVTASVNFATERARVTFPERMSVDDLVATVAATGYTASPPTDSVAPDDRRRLIVSAVVTVPVLVLAMVPAWQFLDWQWVVLALATPVAVWGALPFHHAAWTNARHGTATMDTLISLGVITSYLFSLYALVLGTAGEPGMRMDFHLLAPRGSAGSDIYFEVGAALTTFLLAGRFIEARAKRRSGAALRALLELGAKDVAVLREGREVRAPIADLAVDDLFVVRPGEKIATDGQIVDGNGAVDASMVTGESVPVDVGPGDAVIGATVNAGGRLTIRATRVGAQTQLAQMARLVSDAQSGKANVARLADRVSAVFVPIVIAISIGVFIGWWAIGAGSAAAITSAVAVLIVACPCALGLATPTALLVGTGRGAQLGILIKGPQVLESTRKIDTVVLDKTGTVTTGRMTVVEVVPAAGSDVDTLLRLAAAVEHASEHPIAQAIVRAASAKVSAVAPGAVTGGVVAAFGGADDALVPAGNSALVEEPVHAAHVNAVTAVAALDDPSGVSAGDTLPPVTAFQALAGLGARGIVNGMDVLVGRERLLREHGVDVSGAHSRATVLVAADGVLLGALVVTDTPKPDAAEAITQLRRLGLHPVLLTGDSEAAAHAVAAQVGIDEVIAGVMPAEKVSVVHRLQASGRTVAMVGDGVNDAAALATADLGIAMGTGTDVAIEASDLTLVRGDLTSAADAIRLARATFGTIRANLFWAFAYNVAAIPLAAFGLVTPVIAAAAMAGSSIFVVTNSLRLFRFRPVS
jgi:Cu+-exporting ATPase